MCYVCSTDVYIALPNWAIAQWWACCSCAHRPGSNLDIAPKKILSVLAGLWLWCVSVLAGLGNCTRQPKFGLAHMGMGPGSEVSWPESYGPFLLQCRGGGSSPPIKCFYVYIALTEAILLLKWLELVLRRNNYLNHMLWPPIHSWFLRTVWFHGPLPCDFEKWGFLSKYLHFYSLRAWW